MKKNLFVTFAAALFAISTLFTGALTGHADALTFQSNSGATAPNSPVAVGTSLNWAGYSATGGTFTSVNGSWTIPQSTAPADSTNGVLSADATWVGIGGLSSKDLIQAGTQTIFQNGSETYEAWYETLPNTSQAVPLTVHPGDAVTVSVTEQSTNEWNISFADHTTGQSYNTSVSYQSSLSSAEWIEEMPSDGSGFVTLDNFGTASFTNASAVENGNQVTVSGANGQSVTMINTANQALATPSSLGANGASFTVTRTNVVSSSVSTPTIYIGRSGFGGSRWTRTGVGVQGYTAPPRNRAFGTTTTSGSPTGTNSSQGQPAAAVQTYTIGTGNGSFTISFQNLNGFPSFFRTFVNNFRMRGRQ